MSIRQAMPMALRPFLRNAYVGVGSLYTATRREPGFLLVGGQRCGTTSLFRALEQHPQIIRPTFNKGINYFDLNYHRGRRWYKAHFPVAHGSRGREDAIAFEASGYYMFHPLAPARIAESLPDVKIVAMLRDPVERAYSAWKHETARGLDDVPFEEAIEREEERTRGERERMRSEPGYQSYAVRHYSYTARGDYVSQLREFYDRLPESHVHVVYSESFFENPEREFGLLTDFLGVEEATGIVFDQHNARPSGPMPGRSRELLNESFSGQADELERLIGRRPPWAGGSKE